MSFGTPRGVITQPRSEADTSVLNCDVRYSPPIAVLVQSKLDVS